MIPPGKKVFLDEVHDDPRAKRLFWRKFMNLRGARLTLNKRGIFEDFAELIITLFLLVFAFVIVSVLLLGTSALSREQGATLTDTFDNALRAADGVRLFWLQKDFFADGAPGKEQAALLQQTTQGVRKVLAGAERRLLKTSPQQEPLEESS